MLLFKSFVVSRLFLNQIESIIKLWSFISIVDLIKYQKPIVNSALIFFSKLTVKK